MSYDTDDLVSRLRKYISDNFISRETSEAASMIERQAARIATLEQELRNIANADTVAWDDPAEFEAWAKSRARHTLGKT